MSQNSTAPLLELRDVTKTYPGVLANDRVSLSLQGGEVLGILGENGAGKSTLMNIISGLTAPDSGEIMIDGEPARFASCADAIARGVGMVHQHFMLVPTLTVAENVALGDHRKRSGRLDLDGVKESVRALGEEIGLPVDPDARVGALDVGGQQRVEIIKALYRDARILILDEPTAVLSRQESAGLFAMIRRLTARGVAVILISHKLDDIFEICHRVTVMRQGAVVDAGPVSDRTRKDLVRAMVGEDIVMPARGAGGGRGEELLDVENLTVDRDNGSTALSDVTFQLRKGEILALAGVEGNGQRELVEALTGLRTPRSGSVTLGGDRRSGRRGVRALRRSGIRHVPENRHENGILPSLPLTENFLLSHFFSRRFARLGWLNRREVRREVERLIEAFDIRAPGPQTAIAALSGGNQQKLVLAREFGLGPTILIAAHPTRGLDVRTISFVQGELLRQRDEGMAILLVSSDLSEIWEVADRVMVSAAGRLIGPIPIDETTVNDVGSWMAGR